MKIKRLIQFLLNIIAFFVLLIALVFVSSLDYTFKEQLIVEFIGSGLMAAIVSGFFFFVQETGEYQAKKQKSDNFLTYELIPTFKESISRGKSLWMIDSGKEFFFDSSFINPFFDLINKDINEIRDCFSYYPSSHLLNKLLGFYSKARRGYVLSEKTESYLRRFIRVYNHGRGLDLVSDPSVIMYIKGKVFAEQPDEVLVKYLYAKSIPDFMHEAAEVVGHDKELSRMLKELNIVREDLIEDTKNIIDLVEKI